MRDANAEPEAIAHHFTEACLDDLAIEWWGKAGDHALRRSAFQEAIAHLGKAIEMADRAGATARRATGGPAAPNRKLTRLQVAYGNALIAARGYGAPETTAAFARARELASDDKGAAERLAADYGLWVGGYVRGELTSMRAHAAVFLSDVEAKPDFGEAGVAHRVQGSPISLRENMSKRDIIWNARSLCSNLVATTIWPFASDMTLASRPWSICRWCHGPSAKSIERFRSSTACRRGSRAQAILVRMGWERRTRPCSN